MDEAGHQRIKELFALACEKTAAERPAFLREACGDDEQLMAEVESLLRFHDDADATLPSNPQVQAQPATAAADGPPPRLDAPPAGPPPRKVSGTADTRTTGRFEPGEVFAGRYRIVALLGVGGMGEVYQAHDQVLDVPVALKFITQTSEHARQSLLNEVKLAREVTHPNVCRVFDVAQVGSEYYFTMEYVGGEDLASLLRQVGRFTPDRVAELARQICHGLAAAHARGVLHHDLKPANILIDKDGVAKITDFGIAGIAGAGPQLAGTPAYMPPERLAGQAGSVQSDLYALGLVLYELACGERVFHARTPLEYAELHRSVEPEPLAQRVPDVDPRLAAVVERCLQKDPRDRPRSALEVEAALPGGDALRLAVELGLTPSPEMVANARSPSRGLRPAAAAMLVLWLVAGLVFVALVAERTFRPFGAAPIKPPEVLAERAREMVRELGYPDEPFDEAWGIDAPSPGVEGDLAYTFWYRSSAFAPLYPLDMYNIVADQYRVTDWDPPLTPLDEGMVKLRLDASGRLVMFYVVPPLYDAGLPEPLPPDPETGGPDIRAALRRAGVEAWPLTDAEPINMPPFYADFRGAWKAPDPRGDGEIHVDVAGLGGRLVYFTAFPEGDGEEYTEEEEGFFKRMAAYAILFDVGVVVLALVAVMLALASRRHHRADARSASTVAAVVVALKLALWVLAADHALEVVVSAAHAVLGVVLVEAALLWLAYVGFEPAVRRLWPQTLVAWNRLLRGRWRDPQIGRALLIGSVAGVGWTVAHQLDRLAASTLGLATSPEIAILAQTQLETALNGRMPFAVLFYNAIYAIYAGILWLLLFAILRLLLRRPKPALAVFVLCLGTSVMLDAGHLEISWLLALVLAGTSAWLLIRFGLLTWIVALMVQGELVSSPITTDFSAWYAGSGTFGLVTVLVLGLAGCWTALGGRSLAGGLLTVEPASSLK